MRMTERVCEMRKENDKDGFSTFSMDEQSNEVRVCVGGIRLFSQQLHNFFIEFSMKMHAMLCQK